MGFNSGFKGLISNQTQLALNRLAHPRVETLQSEGYGIYFFI